MSESKASCTPLNSGGAFLSGTKQLTDTANVELALQVAREIACLHAAGRIHRAIHEITLDLQLAPQLAPPSESRAFGGPFADIESCPPELQDEPAISLPADIGQAVRALRERSISMRPERVDVYQLGALFCRIVSGQSVASYLKSSQVKAGVHPNLRAIIDAVLGYDPSTRCQTVDELSAAIKSYREDVDASGDADKSLAHHRQNAAPLPSQADGSPGADRKETGAGANLPFDRLAHYEILDRIGRGGMGDVYKGYERSLDRVVAIKVLPADFARHREFVDRFRAEATAVASITHPNVVQVHFIGEDQGHHFFAMQYIDGESVAELLHRRGRLACDEALAIIEQVLAGLKAAHDKGIIHRDIKPGNVLIDRENCRAFVADFGLVKSLSGVGNRTATGIVMGTVDYVSPEQGRGDTVDARSDLYSVGVFAYQLLSGELPFQADSPTAMIFQHVYEEPTPLGQLVLQLPLGLEAIVGKLMAKAPQDRYQTAAEVLVDVRALRAGREPDWVGRAPAQPCVREACAGTLEQAEITHQLGDDLFVPEELAPPRMTWWARARDGMFGRLQALSPELAERLQNTQQLFAGAVAEYQRRYDRLNAVLTEAEDATADLRRRREDCAAARDAGVDCSDEIAGLDAVLADQEDEIEELRLEVARVRAKLGQLRNQRDLLDARLKTAQARPRLHGALRSRHRVPTTVAATVCGLLVVGGVVSLIIWARPRTPSNTVIPSYSLSSTAVEPSLASVAGHLQSIVLDAPVNCLVFAAYVPASTETRLAVGLDQGVAKVLGFDPKGSQHQEWTCQADRANILSLAFSPDGRLLATGNSAGLIRIWEAPAGMSGHSETPHRVLSGHAAAVGFLRFSDDGSQVLSASVDGTARLWNVLAEREINLIKVSDGYKVANNLGDGRSILLAPRLTGGDHVVSPAPNHLASLGFVGGKLRTIDMAVGEEIWEPLVYNSRGRNGCMLIWQLDNPVGMRKLGTEIWSAGLSADGRVALTSMTDGSLVVWDLSRDVEIARIIDATGRHSPPKFGRVAVSRDGEFGATVDATTVHLWKLPPPPPAGLLNTFHLRSELYTVAISPDGTLAAAGTPNGVKYWRLEGSAGAQISNPSVWRLNPRVSDLIP